MFAVRALVASAAMFALLYLGVSALVAVSWRVLTKYAASPVTLARMLFAARIAPLVIATAVVGAFAVPGFLRFEPRTADEAIGALPLALCAALAWIVLAGTVRAMRAYIGSARWLKATVESDPHCARMLAVSAAGAPPIAIAGLLESKILISREAAGVLTEAELHSAIEHERAHAHSRDNLKKLVLEAVRMPGLRALDRAWLDSIEFAADAKAVASESQALDLASALVKIARLQSSSVMPTIVSGFADGSRSLLQARVERLMKHCEVRESRNVWIPAALSLAALAVVVKYGAVLAVVYEITEIVVR